MQLLKEITTANIDESKREWAKKWAPKILEQVKLEARTSTTIMSRACGEVISVGKNFTET